MKRTHYRHTFCNFMVIPKNHGIQNIPWFLIFSGAGKRTRTPNMLITIQLLYQLSYAGARNIIAQISPKIKVIKVLRVSVSFAS